MSDQQIPKATTDRLRDHADSSSDNLEPVELLADDFMRRQRAGENPSIEEYFTQYPELSDEIREVFPALVVIERVAPVSADLDESARTLRSPDDQPIESIGDYRILREIGRGGMGVVYEAEQESLGRRVALKVLPRQVASDEKALLRFQREARAAAKMHHTNIVPVFEVGRDKEFSFYAMQLIQGQGLDHVIGDLRELRSQVTGKQRDKNRSPQNGIENSLAASLINGHFEQQNLFDSADVLGGQQAVDGTGSKEVALTETLIQSAGSTVSASLPGQSEVSTAEDNRAAYFRSVAEIGLQASRALAYAHARGITHRDIKPSNLILDTGGVVWITDFGLARTGDSSMTQTGDILGTIRYMSPERFKGQCDNRADVYSLGLTLYEMLVLKPAYESPDRLQLIDIVTKTEVPAPRTIESGVPRDLETIVLKSADKDPKRRYQSADDMADDLQRFVNDEPILARRASPAERVARWSRRNPWLATAMSVSAVALIAITGISIAAAQTQSTLNGQLTQANAELKSKTEEQRETNEALVASNRTKEDLIRDLKRSQSRLAEKQAEFVAEKGDLAESMLWLARSYEQADENDTATRNRLLARLTQSAAKMPQLVREVPVQSRIQSWSMLQRVFSIATGREEEAPILNLARNSAAVSNLFAPDLRMGGQPGILVIPTWSDDKGEKVEQVRCFDRRSGKWIGKAVRCEGIHGHHAVHEQKRWLATLSFVVDAVEGEETPPSASASGRQSPANVDVEEIIVVRDIDSGDVIYESRQEFERDPSLSSRGAGFIGPAIRCNSTRIRFTSKGDALLRNYSAGNTRGFPVDRISIPSGETSSNDVQTSKTGSGRSVGGSLVCRSGRRLFVADNGPRQLGGSSVLRSNSTRNSQLHCYDVETGEPIGQPIRYDDGNPLILSEEGDRVAVIRADGDRRWIQVHDVNTGEHLGDSLDLHVPLTTTVRLRDCSADGNRLLVSCLPLVQSRSGDRTKLAGSRGFVQVFDPASRSAVTPPLPTSGSAMLAVFSAHDQLIIQDTRQIRTWKLSSGNVARTIYSFGGGMRRGLLQAVEGNRLIMASQSCTTWDGATGRLLESKSIRESGEVTQSRPRVFSSNGRFLLKGFRKTGGRQVNLPAGVPYRFADDRFQRWDIRQGKPIGEVVSLNRDDNPLALGPNGRLLAVGFAPTPAGPSGGRFRRGTPPVMKLRIENLESGTSTEVPPPREPFLPIYASFSGDGQRLFVVGELRFDVFDVSDDQVEHTSEFELTDFSFRFQRSSTGVVNSPVTAVSLDGSLLAGFGKNGNLLVQDVRSGSTIHSVDFLKYSRPSGFGQTANVITIAPEGDALYVSEPSGLIYRSEFRQQWSGKSDEVYERLSRVTGLKFGENDTVQVASLATDTAWVAHQRSDDDPLDEREWTAIQRYKDGDWDAAAAELRQWSARRPDDWIPLGLRILPLVKLRRLDEATTVWNQLVALAGRPTAGAWLRTANTSRELNRRSSQARGKGLAYNNLTPESASTLKWFQTRQLEAAADDSERAGYLFDIAKAEEVHLNLSQAADTIDEAVRLNSDSADMHYYRAHLMERINRWSDAIESRAALMRLEPDGDRVHFRLAAAYLHTGDMDAFWRVWHEYLEKCGRGSDIYPLDYDRIAKLRLCANTSGHELETALDFADKAFQLPQQERNAAALEGFFILCKGMAEIRRGPEHAEQAIEHLDNAFEWFGSYRNGSYKYGQATTRFFAAMAYYQTGDEDIARTAYLDGVDRHSCDRECLQGSKTSVWSDWHLAEVVRRESAALLKIDESSIDRPVPDTTDWTVLLEDNFDDGISEEWERMTGKWTVVAGAACGTLKRPEGATIDAYDRLERRIEDLPTTFEVEYEVWTSDPMLAACFLRLPSESPGPLGHRVALTSYPDRQLVNQGRPGTGVNLVVNATFGYWVEQSVPDVEFEPNQHYKVRIIRQPNRITAFVDDKQVFSNRVRNIETRSIRFFARGEEGTKMFVDNFRLRTPPLIPESGKNNE